jgi:hypothetical protein
VAMTLYHRTTTKVAEAILGKGFRDGRGNYLTESTYSGVWLSLVPLDANEGACGEVFFELVTDMTEPELAEFEWIEEGKPYREFLVPAKIVNARMRITSQVTAE